MRGALAVGREEDEIPGEEAPKESPEEPTEDTVVEVPEEAPEETPDETPEVELLGVHENFTDERGRVSRRAYYFGCADIAFGWTAEFLKTILVIDFVRQMRAYVNNAQKGMEPCLPREGYSSLFGPLDMGSGEEEWVE